MTNLIFLTKLGTAILLVCFLCMTTCKAVNIGGNCNDDVECTGYTNSKCVSGTCDCVATHYSDGSDCQPKKSLDAACGGNNECSDANAECSSTCQCKSTHYNNGGTCSLKKSLGTACGADIQCSDVNAECSGTCLCKSTHYNNGGTCTLKNNYGVACNNVQECKATLICSTTCTCASSDYWTGSICTAKKSLGAACGADIQCSDVNAECSSTCQCKSTHYNNGGTCTLKNNYGVACNNVQECKATLICSTTCTCASSDYWTGSICTAKKSLGAACGADIQCSDVNAECSSTCQCKSTHYNNGGTCTLKKNYGVACNNVQECKATLICSTTCTCASSDYWTGSICTAKKSLGTACGADIQCSDVNAECSSTCQCKSTHYNNGGTCTLKKNYGVACNNVQECKATLICSTTCTCASSDYWTGSICTAKKSLGTACGADIQCSDVNAECSGSTCQCKSTHYNNAGTCSQKKSLGGTCTADIQCSDDNAECSSSTCQCKSTHYNYGGTCSQRKTHGVACTNAQECKDTLICSTTCTCASSDYWTGTKCTAKIALDSGCTDGGPSGQCVTPNAECKDSGGNGGYKCLCLTSHYKSVSTCIERKTYGVACSNAQECKDTLICSTTCTCASANYWTGSTCTTKIALNTTCSSTGPSDQCADPNAECRDSGNGGGHKCLCLTSHYKSETSCLAKKSLGVTCGGNNECSDAKAVCSVTCQCISSHYNNSGTCSPKKSLGDVCTDASECADSNAECSGGTCQCKSTHYRDESACSPKKNLGVTCGDTVECLDDNAECNGTCQCVSTHYAEGNACKEKKSLGTSCSNIVECSDPNSVCSGTCQCKSTHYTDDTTCTAKKPPGGQCSTEGTKTECSDSNSVCSSENKCKCTADYYDSDLDDNNVGGTCVIRLQSGVKCTQTGQTFECISNAECKSNGTSDTTCTCETGYYDQNFSGTGGMCVAEKDLGDPCTQSGKPTECVPNAVCLSIGMECTCTPDYYDSNSNTDGGTCVPKILVDDPCTNGGPSDQCKDSLSACTGSKCACNTNYYNNGGVCTLQTDVGAPCTTSSQCKDDNSECRAGTGGSKQCLCKANYYDFSGICTLQIALEAVCINERPENQCFDGNAACIYTISSGQYRCLCKNDFYKNNAGSCTQQVDLNGQCTEGEPTDQCSDSNAICTPDSGSHTCLCKSDYYANSANICTPKVVLNAVCTTGQPDNQCIDNNAACQEDTTSNYKCLCKSDFYENKDVQCAKKSILGAECIQGESALQCSVPQTECISNTDGKYECTCMTSYYRDEQTCKALSGLTVSALTVSRDSTGETYFLITWSNPAAVSFINNYQLQINAVGGTVEGTIDIQTSKTEYNVTNRLQGQTYNITFISVETATRPSPQTISASITAGTRPAIPGAIIKTDILGPIITLSWTITGVLQHLSGTINGTTVTPNTFNFSVPSGQAPAYGFNNVKHGERYVLTVKAYSNGFTSAVNEETIRTTPQKPNPPIIDDCVTGDLFETYLNLRWQEPTIPNGDILYYIIHMTGADTRTINTIKSTLVQKIDNLLPERYYTFNIQTVNDATISQSDYSVSKQCRTRAGVATIPEDVAYLDIQSRSIKVSWNKPADPKGFIYGYHVIMRVETVCQVEIIYQCTDCGSSSNILFTACNTPGKQRMKNINSTIANSMVTSTIDNLLPFVNYEIWIAAVNGNGDGEKNETFIWTDSEVPQKSTSLEASVKSATQITLTWIQPTPRPGITKYYVKAYEIVEGTSSFVKFINITGFDNQVADFTGLEEYWEYTFSVTASTVKGPIISDMTTPVRTHQAAPGKVEELKVTKPPDNFTQMIISWKIPLLRERNGVITKYVVKHNISGVMAEEPAIAATNSSLTLTVETEKYYSIEVYAVNSLDQEGTVDSTVYFAPPGPPITPTYDAVVTKTDEVVSTQNTLTLIVSGDWFFHSKDNGMFTDYGVIVCLSDKCEEYGKDTKLKQAADFRIVKTWKEAQQENFNVPYKATNESFIVDRYLAAVGRRKRDSHEVTLKIGEDSGCSKREKTVYCNGPLNPGKSYSIVTFVCTNGGCTESDQFGPYATQQVPDDDLPIGIIAGAVGAVVAAVVVIIIVVVVIKKRKNRPDKMTPEDPIEFDNPAGLQTPSMERKNIRMKRPVILSDFADKVEELHRDSNLKFAHEYEEVKVATDPKTLRGATTELAETDENKLKNRYVNILPYDKTIVKLLPLEDDDENASTFINANYIPGYKSQREYIATQGPIPSTIDDFWRMVWEQSVSIIVMLTLCKEDGRIKCECYWPTESSEPKQYRDIVVEMISCSTINTYEIRIFKLTLGDKSRNIKHFHFLNWKDFSANVQNDVMVDFIQNVRNHVTIPESKVPMIVHCSAGVGRTGTYIALDHLMQFIAEHDFSSSIDIFDLVVKMRHCRMYMVQTEQQYIFIHDCIKDILERKRRKELESENDGLYGNVNVQQDNIYDNQAFEPDLYQNVNLNPKTEL